MTVLYAVGIILLLIRLLPRGNSLKRFASPAHSRSVSYIIILTLLAGIRVSEFDLYFSDELRHMFELYGWYEERRPWQIILLILICLPAMGLFSVEFSRISRESWSNRLTAMGICLLVALISLNLISFHYTDVLLRIKIGSLTGTSLLELLALLMVVAPQLHYRATTTLS